MRRIAFCRCSILLVLVFLLGPGRAQGQSTADLTRKLERLNAYPDLIAINGKISTMDEWLTEVEAMAEGNLTLEDIRAARISTEHSPIIRPDQVPTMAKYGIRPDFTMNTVQGDIKAGAFVKTYGEQYMSWIAPAKSLVNAGVHPVMNTDAHMYKVPVEWKDMDYPPQWEGNTWGFIEFFVTRRMPHDGITYNRAEALDRVSAMKAATIWGAEQVLREDHIGSLEVGKLADFIVIDKDYFTIPEDQIGTIKTLLTAVGGKTVYRASNY